MVLSITGRKSITFLGTQPAPNSTGFTLIELLVVIAIISLLVSILLPSLQNAKELARKAACQSNLHTLSLAMAMYLNDFNGQFPLVWYKNPDKYHWIVWTDRLVLGGYVNYGGFFLCPSRPTDDNYQEQWENASEKSALYQGFWQGPDYGYNADGIGGTSGVTANISEVTNPSDVILFADSIFMNHGTTDTKVGVAFLYDRYKPPSSGEYYYVDPRHLDGCNIAWVDGHVSSVQKSPDVINPYDAMFDALDPYWHFK